MSYKLHKTVALVGMMGAGKTAVGRTLAAMLDVPFKDSDQAITEAADRSIFEIFERDGEAFFRDREAEVIARLMTDEPSILSTGGGAFMQDRNRRTVQDRGVSVWLKADLDLLWNRVRHKDTRPLLRTDNPRQTLADLAAAREPFYEQADLVVEADAAYSLEDMAAKVRDALLTRPDVLREAD